MYVKLETKTAQIIINCVAVIRNKNTTNTEAKHKQTKNSQKLLMNYLN